MTYFEAVPPSTRPLLDSLFGLGVLCFFSYLRPQSELDNQIGPGNKMPHYELTWVAYSIATKRMDRNNPYGRKRYSCQSRRVPHEWRFGIKYWEPLTNAPIVNGISWPVVPIAFTSWTELKDNVNSTVKIDQMMTTTPDENINIRQYRISITPRGCFLFSSLVAFFVFALRTGLCRLDLMYSAQSTGGAAWSFIKKESFAAPFLWDTLAAIMLRAV
jgi:hypothetical protein